MWRVVLVVSVLVMGCTRGTVPSHSVTAPTAQSATNQMAAALPASAPRRFSQGEVLYLRRCSGCHGWEGQGNGPVAQQLEIKPPSLRNAKLFTQHTEAELVARILLGKDLRVPYSSPATLDTEADTTALISYLRRLPTVSWEKVEAGEDVYDSLCLSCHGIYGRGDGIMSPSLSPPPRDLSSPAFQSQASDEELTRIISEGKGAMPGAADVLSAAQIRTIVDFVRLLSPGFESYDRFCTGCHGSDGHPPSVAFQEKFGAPLGAEEQPPVFDQTYMQTHSDEHLRVWVRHMFKENRVGMPHFAGTLTAEQVRQILAYLRSLPPTP